MARKIDEGKKELAYILYMNGETNKAIAERLGVNEKTIGKWAEDGGWKEKRAAKTTSREELCNRMLIKLSEMFEDGVVNADEASKIASAIEKIDKQNNNIYSAILLFMDFGKFIGKLVGTEITSEDMKLIVRLQDRYIQSKR